MTPITQLRTRSEYSFRSAYGPMPVLAASLAELGVQAAGLVDTAGTWGHVTWEREARKAGIEPLFGTEFTIPGEGELKPRCWALATDLPSFYRLSSANPKTQEAMIEAEGVVRFAGAALTDPDAFDFIDINPRSKMATQRALQLHKDTGKPLVFTSDADYPLPEHRAKFLAWDDSKKLTLQHLLSAEEARHAMRWVPGDYMDDALKNIGAVLERTQGLKLRAAPMISVPGDLRALVEEGRQMRLKRGHIKDWTEEYQARLDRELDLIEEKDYASYFMVVADMVCWAKERMLVGPARGSSAGSLVCFLLRITEVDPLVHGLIFERFIDVNRADLPDIDIDFNDKKRPMVFDYLGERYGAENVARIGSVSRLKPRSVMPHVAKKLGIEIGATFNVLNVLIEHSSGDARFGKSLEDTMTTTKPGQEFAAKYPEAALMGELENHASHTGQHAAGIIVANVPVVEYCTVRDGIAQIDKKDAEDLNLLKIDALGLRTLGVLEDAGILDNEDFYDLPLTDQSVLDIFNEGKYSGIFQFEGASQRRVAAQVNYTQFYQIDQVTALARPGPLGGGATEQYLKRHAGEAPVEYWHPSMEAYLGDTLGLVLYQEQVMKIVREIGGFSWEQTSVVRKAMSGRKGKEFFDAQGDQFVEGCVKKGLDADESRELWKDLCNFGGWGMNKSHTASYAIISYWCAYMKRYHPLAYAAASLRNAKDDEQTLEILRELRDEGVEYVPFDAQRSAVSWSVVDGILLGGYDNLVGIGPIKAAHFVDKRNGAGLDEADLEKLAKHKPKHEDLNPAHTLWGDIYENPDAYNIHGRVKQLSELEDGENACVLGRIVKTDRRDKNEALLVGKRGYKMKGQTLFLDFYIVDDSVTASVRCRIGTRDWNWIGEKVADRAIVGEEWVLVRGKWLARYSMLSVNKMKSLSNPDMLS